MKHRPWIGLACMTALAPLAMGQIVFTQTYNLGSAPVPDGDPTGLADTESVAPSGYVSSVTVQAVFGGDAASNGDLYMYLQHGSSLAVLLNRPGVDVGNPTGYGDPGMQITFDDAAANGDIHIYRQTLFGSDSVPLGGPLTDSIAGAWQPDGRKVDPTLVTTADPRTATLSVFNGQQITGAWTLFVADVATGHQTSIDSWTLTINYGLTGPSVPEGDFVEPMAWGMAAMAVLRRRRKARRSA